MLSTTDGSWPGPRVRADRDESFEGAEISERGTHEQLLAAGGAYFKMYRTEAESVAELAGAKLGFGQTLVAPDES
jgi:hypothetical protein